MFVRSNATMEDWLSTVDHLPHGPVPSYHYANLKIAKSALRYLQLAVYTVNSGCTRGAHNLCTVLEYAQLGNECPAPCKSLKPSQNRCKVQFEFLMCRLRNM